MTQGAAIDPITLEVIRNKLSAIPEQIEANITRTAFSPLIYEYKDFAVGLVDIECRLISQGKGGIPLFVANILGAAVEDGIRFYGKEGFAHGDVVICNYSGVLGQHLNNVVMYTPVFAHQNDAVPVAFLAIAAHWSDVGGREVGSSATNDTVSIFQEGIQFRTVKLHNAGQPVQDIYRMIEFNTRFPVVVLGDVASQLGGCLLGRDLYQGLLQQYGADTVQQAIHRLWQQSERLARQVIEGIPDGTYTAYAELDDDGVQVGQVVPIPVTVRVLGNQLEVDFSDIAPVLKGPFNSGALGGGITAARIAMSYLLPHGDAPNEGTFRCLSVVLPEGKFLSAPATAPMARYSTPLATVIDVVLRAVGQARPDLVAGGHHGAFGVHVFSGKKANGELFKNLETGQGGFGASQRGDGSGPFKTYAHGDTFNVPVELQEALYPVRFESLSLRTDSGGAGQFRGGLGVSKRVQVLLDCHLNVSMDRTRCPPWGVNAGHDGASGQVILNPGTAREERLKKADRSLRKGDLVQVDSGGGGGYGEPHKRAPALIAQDLVKGYVSETAAAEIYGYPDASASSRH
jgi:N-methylhydantoinase B